MEVYGFYLEYYNEYQKFSYRISHKACGRSNENWIELEGDNVELDETGILFFERLFASPLKIAYVDLVSADETKLNTWRYRFDGPIVLIHKVVWRHLDDRATYIVYLSDEEGERIIHLDENEEIKEFFSKLGIPVF
jgi:hypothetical protein